MDRVLDAAVPIEHHLENDLTLDLQRRAPAPDSRGARDRGARAARPRRGARAARRQGRRPRRSTPRLPCRGGSPARSLARRRRVPRCAAASMPRTADASPSPAAWRSRDGAHSRPAECAAAPRRSGARPAAPRRHRRRRRRDRREGVPAPPRRAAGAAGASRRDGERLQHERHREHGVRADRDGPGRESRRCPHRAGTTSRTAPSRRRES